MLEEKPVIQVIKPCIAAEGEVLRDDIVHSSAVNKAHGKGEGMEGIQLLHAEFAESMVNGGVAVNGTVGKVGAGAMASLAGDLNGKENAAGHDRAFPQGNKTAVQIGIGVAAVGAVNMDLMIQNITVEIDDVVGSFFAPFKHQENTPLNFFPVRSKNFGSGQEHGDMGVMAAGMADSWVFGNADFVLIEILRHFLYGEGIHICPQEDCADFRILRGIFITLALKKAQKNEGLSEDTEKEAEGEVQKVTDKNIKSVDELIAAKEKEIMTV